jgi:indolepyruvate ferredoxin oxidoreductase beta subunit
VIASIRIVVAALGGEGGGVLARWIADMAEREGYLSQTTSVPGVAQRTGATIYYLEIFPRAEAEAAGRLPVMSMFPTPGDVDIVISSEIVEAGRMIQRGFVTPDRTTLVTSTHRVFGITEKEAMGSGMVDKEAIVEVARARSKTCIGFDMLETARKFDSVINAALFGALAETGVLPFSRQSFEETIRRGKIAVDSNLLTFAASYELARQQHNGGSSAVNYVEPAAGAGPAPAPFSLPRATSTEGDALLTRIATFPLPAREMIYLGVKKLIDYQDSRYAHLYLDRLQSLQVFEGGDDAALTTETARFLALWMAFEDLPRVAQIKISPERFERFREEVRAQQGQQVGMVEFLHPRVEEFCGIMPAGLGRYVLDSASLRRIIGLFAKPRNVRTNSLPGFLLFYLMSGLRRFRRSSLVYQLEHAHMERWLDAIRSAAPADRERAVELARCGRLIKGYGATRERGTGNMQRILAVCERLPGLSAPSVRALREAALSGEDGAALTALEGELLAAR